jgi:hypothetical protein
MGRVAPNIWCIPVSILFSYLYVEDGLSLSHSYNFCALSHDAK